MNDTSETTFTNKSFPELEKELEEAVRSVEIPETLQNKSYTYAENTKYDINLDSLKFDEDNNQTSDNSIIQKESQNDNHFQESLEAVRENPENQSIPQNEDPESTVIRENNTNQIMTSKNNDENNANDFQDKTADVNRIEDQCSLPNEKVESNNEGDAISDLNLDKTVNSDPKATENTDVNINDTEIIAKSPISSIPLSESNNVAENETLPANEASSTTNSTSVTTSTIEASVTAAAPLATEASVINETKNGTHSVVKETIFIEEMVEGDSTSVEKEAELIDGGEVLVIEDQQQEEKLEDQIQSVEDISSDSVTEEIGIENNLTSQKDTNSKDDSVSERSEIFVIQEITDKSPDFQGSLVNSRQEIVIINDEEGIELIEAEVTESLDSVSSNSPEIIIVKEDIALENQNDLQKKHNEELKTGTTAPEEHVKEKKPEKTVKIPCHVLGRNVENPTVDSAGNGRVPPKPRLGVKIPYRNLTSQIVSKQEIAEEIMERSRQRNATLEPPSGDVLFARKLTQRLARKLASVEKPPDKKSSPSKGVKKMPIASSTPNTKSTSKDERPVASTSEIIKTKQNEVQKTSTPQKPVTSDISNQKSTKEQKNKIDNSDLLAILEGDGDEDWPDLHTSASNSLSTKSATPSKVFQKPNKPIEKPVLPVQTKTNILKSLQESEKKDVEKTSSNLISNKIDNKEASVSNESNSEKNTDLKLENDDFNSELKFSSSLVTKTYTRKRKPSEDVRSLSTSQPVAKKPVIINKPVVYNKVNIDLAPNTYISKSSRIVKRKVIWDPDEAVPMSKLVTSKPRIDPKANNSTEKMPDKKIIKIEKAVTSPTVKLIADKKISAKAQVTENIQEKVIKKVSKVSPEKSTSKKAVASSEKSIDDKISGSESIVKKEEPKVISEKTIKIANKSSPDKSGTKKIISPIKKSPMKNKQATKTKRLTEIDRLLMDEGAVNMLYAVKNTEDSESTSKLKTRKKSVISIDNFHQELLDKTNEIKNDLQMNSSKESPKSLRKKENVMPMLKKVEPVSSSVTRKKSKDSLRSSVHSPPASPAYPFSQSAEASRIIRRHSSSSFSSVGSRSESINDENKSANGDLLSRSTSSTEKGASKVGKHKSSVTDLTKGKKIRLSRENSNLKKQKQKTVAEKDASDRVADSNIELNLNEVDITTKKSQSVTLKKFDSLVQIILSSTSSHLTAEVLDEISSALNKLSNDETCNVVVLTSSGSSFCQGIDYRILAVDNESKRKSIAEKVALSLRNFLKNLATFPKLIVAGVHGNAIGLGVTMLPLFDMVLASDSATFSTPYACLGCTAEGGSLLSLPNMMHNALASELFFASRKLTAAEALRFGLVTRTLWPDKFQEELLSTLKLISNQSIQGTTSIKKNLRHMLLSEVDLLLKSESNVLVQHWTSAECQSNFKNYSLVE